MIHLGFTYCTIMVQSVYILSILIKRVVIPVLLTHFYDRILSTEQQWRNFVVVLLFYVHGKHPRSCRDGQLT